VKTSSRRPLRARGISPSAWLVVRSILCPSSVAALCLRSRQVRTLRNLRAGGGAVQGSLLQPAASSSPYCEVPSRLCVVQRRDEVLDLMRLL
jgi:hypothetical protein